MLLVETAAATTMEKQHEDEVGDKFPRFPYKISQFCELLSFERHYKHCEALFVINS